MSKQVIFSIIAQLLEEGKTPSTALIKSRLPEPVPVPVIIQALAAWRRNPQLAQPAKPESVATQPSAAAAPTLESLQARIEQLEHQVTLLSQKLSRYEH